MVPSSVVSTMSMSANPRDSSTSLITPEPQKLRRPPGAALDNVRSGAAASTDCGRATCERRVFSYEEISQHGTEDDAWIVVDGEVYDVTQFLQIHPGGEEFILEHLQSNVIQDAGPLMRGELQGDGHSHSKAAFRMLEQFWLGSVSASQRLIQFPTKASRQVDLTKPIVAQVVRLGADYDKWVHDPIICKESPRFFESNLCEFLTRTRWWVIPMVWCPVAFGMIYEAVAHENVHVAWLPVLCICGLAIWSFLEYLLHRYLFHMKTSSSWGNTLHYVIHGFHHKHPMDGARLVFPPAFSAIVVAVIWLITYGFPYPTKLVLFGSGLLGYVAYDLTHYFLHFGDAFNDESRRRKRYHLNHHFKDQTNGYGVTTSVWDSIFGTLPPSEERARMKAGGGNNFE